MRRAGSEATPSGKHIKNDSKTYGFLGNLLIGPVARTHVKITIKQIETIHLINVLLLDKSMKTTVKHSFRERPETFNKITLNK